MKKALSLFAVVWFVCLFSGCGTSNSTIPFSEESFHGDNDSVVYIYREASMVGAATSWRVRIDNVIVGKLRQNSYMAIHLAPGVHKVRIGDSGPLIVGAVVEAIADNPGAFKIKEKETYYIRCKGFKVEFLPRNQAIEELKSMKYDMGK